MVKPLQIHSIVPRLIGNRCGRPILRVSRRMSRTVDNFDYAAGRTISLKEVYMVLPFNVQLGAGAINVGRIPPQASKLVMKVTPTPSGVSSPDTDWSLFPFPSTGFRAIRPGRCHGSGPTSRRPASVPGRLATAPAMRAASSPRLWPRAVPRTPGQRAAGPAAHPAGPSHGDRGGPGISGRRSPHFDVLGCILRRIGLALCALRGGIAIPGCTHTASPDEDQLLHSAVTRQPWPQHGGFGWTPTDREQRAIAGISAFPF